MIGVQTTFRQIGAALGLASFVAIVGNSTLATKSDYDGAWVYMAIAAASSGLVLIPLFRHRPGPEAAEPAAPAASFVSAEEANAGPGGRELRATCSPDSPTRSTAIPGEC